MNQSSFRVGLAAMAVILFLMPAAMARETARSQLEHFSDGLQTLHARFSQVVISTDSTIQDRSDGEVWLARPNLFRWAYGGDYPELVVADGVHIWIYDEMLEQVTVKELAATAMESPLVLLTEPGRLEERFEVREAGASDEAALLELRALNPEYEFERILLGLNDNDLVMMIMEDAFGLRTEIRFSDTRRNPELVDDLFRFEAPDGVDVIGDLPGTANQR